MLRRPISNMTDQDVEEVCKILDGWHGEKLTWEGLVKAIELRFDKTWSRQALDRHPRIKSAFTLKKRMGQKSPPASEEDKKIPVELRKALESIERLESENARLKMENEQLLEQFVRWSYNAAAAKGLTREVLDKPLTKIDRGSTRDDEQERTTNRSRVRRKA